MERMLMRLSITSERVRDLHDHGISGKQRVVVHHHMRFVGPDPSAVSRQRPISDLAERSQHDLAISSAPASQLTADAMAPPPNDRHGLASTRGCSCLNSIRWRRCLRNSGAVQKEPEPFYSLVRSHDFRSFPV
jgi:hypothetical protein